MTFTIKLNNNKAKSRGLIHVLYLVDIFFPILTKLFGHRLTSTIIIFLIKKSNIYMFYDKINKKKKMASGKCIL